MRILAIVSFAILYLSPSISGAESPSVNVQWVTLDEHSLQSKCQAMHFRSRMPGPFQRANPNTFNGCYEHSGDTCTIYTRKADPLNDRYQQTLGHEVLHCFLGLYHR